MFFPKRGFFDDDFMIGFSQIIKLSFILHSELENFSWGYFVLVFH